MTVCPADSRNRLRADMCTGMGADMCMDMRMDVGMGMNVERCTQRIAQYSQDAATGRLKPLPFCRPNDQRIFFIDNQKVRGRSYKQLKWQRTVYRQQKKMPEEICTDSKKMARGHSYPQSKKMAEGTSTDSKKCQRTFLPTARKCQRTFLPKAKKTPPWTCLPTEKKCQRAFVPTAKKMQKEIRTKTQQAECLDQRKELCACWMCVQACASKAGTVEGENYSRPVLRKTGISGGQAL